MLSLTGFIDVTPTYNKDNELMGLLTTELSVEELLEIYVIDHTVNRDIQHHKILKLNKYLDEIDSELGIYIPAIILSHEGNEPIKEDNFFIFEKKKNFIVLDGQHRIKAFEYFLENNTDKSKKNTILQSKITTQIYFNLTDREKRQLFIDINSRARRVSKNLAVKYDDRDPVNTLINDLLKNEKNNPLLKMGVDRDKSRIVRPSNKNWISARRLSYFINYLLFGVTRLSETNKSILKNQYEEVLSFLQQYFVFLESSLPSNPGEVKENILGHEALQNAIAVVSHNNIIKIKNNKLDWEKNWRDFIELFALIDWSTNSSLFKPHLVYLGRNNSYVGFADHKHYDLVPLLEKELKTFLS